MTRPRSYWNKDLDAELTDLHQNSHYGIHRLAKHFSVTIDVIYYAVKRLSLKTINVMHTRIHESNSSKSASRRPYEFANRTKKAAFDRDAHLCRWCHLDLGPTYNSPGVTYHHATPVYLGLKLGWSHTQIRALDNCAPIHSSCHADNHEALHQGKHRNFGHTTKTPKPRRLCRCGQPASQIKSDFCRPCAASLFLSDETHLLNMTPCALDDLRKRLIRDGLLGKELSRQSRWDQANDSALLALYHSGQHHIPTISNHFSVGYHVTRKALRRLGITITRTTL